jgi:LacI family transcriptional regulator
VCAAGEAGFATRTERFPQNPWRDVAAWRKTEQALRRCVAAWQPPIGVYVADEGVGRMTVQECHRRGLRVPEDVAIIAGQNEETLCAHPRPTLTSMEIGFERVGYEAARRLHRLLDGEPDRPGPVLIPPIGLIVRETTDFFAVDDELVAAALQFIAGSSHRPIGQDDVSRAVKAQTRTLQNRFRRALGRPIAAEIRRVRIERAKRELAHSRRSLADIARDVGFGVSTRMYEVFRRELGVTPSAYRRASRVNAGPEEH